MSTQAQDQVTLKPLTLSKDEEKTVSRLRPELRAQARQDILRDKEDKRTAYLNDPTVKARKAQDQENRNKVSVRTAESGVICLYGMGRKFGACYHPGEWTKIIANIDLVKAELAKLPAEVK